MSLALKQVFYNGNSIQGHSVKTFSEHRTMRRNESTPETKLGQVFTLFSPYLKNITDKECLLIQKELFKIIKE